MHEIAISKPGRDGALRRPQLLHAGADAAARRPYLCLKKIPCRLMYRDEIYLLRPRLLCG